MIFAARELLATFRRSVEAFAFAGFPARMKASRGRKERCILDEIDMRKRWDYDNSSSLDFSNLKSAKVASLDFLPNDIGVVLLTSSKSEKPAK